jgi:hypothetical protein
MTNMMIKSLLTLAALGGSALYGQPTNGAQYWSTTQPDCSALNETAVAVTNASGTTIGYSCYVAGTFLWLAAGGPWGTSIRVAAPATGAIGVDYSFYDASGNSLSLDTTSGPGASPVSGNDVNFALNANQASEVRLLGAPSEAPGYGTTKTGSVYAIFYCPNAFACETVLPQLLYSSFPSTSLSVPISWDYFYSPVQPQGAWPKWSAAGIDDGGSRRISLVIYNQDTVTSIYTVRVYDSSGNLVGSGTTPPVNPITKTTNGGAFADVLSNIVKTALPSGVIKVTVDGGSNYSAVSMIQTNVLAATSLQVAYDGSSSSSTLATSSLKSVPHRGVASSPRQVFRTLPR